MTSGRGDRVEGLVIGNEIKASTKTGEILLKGTQHRQPGDVQVTGSKKVKYFK